MEVPEGLCRQYCWVVRQLILAEGDFAAKMAERVGFEPTIPERDTAFRERRLRPLGHLSNPISIYQHLLLFNKGWVIIPSNA